MGDGAVGNPMMAHVGGWTDFGVCQFHGAIDEVRISSIARYTSNFTPVRFHEPDELTIALYHLDEDHGEIAHDSSDNNHHGRVIGAKWVREDELPD